LLLAVVLVVRVLAELLRAVAVVQVDLEQELHL
jgi:hypothetical protein